MRDLAFWSRSCQSILVSLLFDMLNQSITNIPARQSGMIQDKRDLRWSNISSAPIPGATVTVKQHEKGKQPVPFVSPLHT
jgi:hypothetical protein